jgi:hypothetical protein
MPFKISKEYRNTFWTDLKLISESDDNWEEAF